MLNQGDDNIKPDFCTADNPFLLEDCWLERMGIQTDEPPHADAIQMQGAGWLTARRTNFDHPYPGSPQWAAKQATNPGGTGAQYKSNAIWQEDLDDPNSNVLLEDCWVNGGNTTLNMRGLGGSNRVLNRIYVGLQNAQWAGTRENVRSILFSGSNYTATNFFWVDTNEPLSGIPVTPTDPPPPPYDPNWRRLVLRVS